MLIVLVFIRVDKMLSLKSKYHKAGVEAGLASKFEPEAESGVKATTVAPFQRANDVRHGELHGPPDWERGLKVGGNLENAHVRLRSLPYISTFCHHASARVESLDPYEPCAHHFVDIHCEAIPFNYVRSRELAQQGMTTTTTRR